MNTDYLRTFLSVAECGSFSRAERQLYLSRQAIIKQINSLENQTGTVLLERSTRGITLTDAGRSFAGQSKMLLDMEYRLFTDAKKAGGLEPGIRIGNVDHHILLEPILIEYRKQYPMIPVKKVFHYNVKEIDLVLQGIVDVGDTRFMEECLLPQLEYLPLLRTPYYCLFPESKLRGISHTGTLPSKMAPEELASYHVAVYERDFEGYYEKDFSILKKSIPHIELISGSERRINMIYRVLSEGKVLLTASPVIQAMDTVQKCELAMPLQKEYGIVCRRPATMEVRELLRIAKVVYPLQK